MHWAEARGAKSRRRAYRAALLHCSAFPSDSECLSVYPTLAPRVPANQDGIHLSYSACDRSCNDWCGFKQGPSWGWSVVTVMPPLPGVRPPLDAPSHLWYGEGLPAGLCIFMSYNEDLKCCRWGVEQERNVDNNDGMNFWGFSGVKDLPSAHWLFLLLSLVGVFEKKKKEKESKVKSHRPAGCLLCCRAPLMSSRAAAGCRSVHWTPPSASSAAPHSLVWEQRQGGRVTGDLETNPTSAQCPGEKSLFIGTLAEWGLLKWIKRWSCGGSRDEDGGKWISAKHSPWVERLNTCIALKWANQKAAEMRYSGTKDCCDPFTWIFIPLNYAIIAFWPVNRRWEYITL